MPETSKININKLFPERLFPMSEKEYNALKNSLASVQIEGFSVTEQTEKDCIRLISGDISVAELVSEIMKRPVQKAG